MARKKNEKSPVTQGAIDRCLAKAVAEGDIVNFRFLFFPYSPLRDGTSEDIDDRKYAYLCPEDEEDARFAVALKKVREPAIQQHVAEQLRKEGPVQLHADLVLMLADNAVALGKFGAAAQAYEVLRIRDRMQAEFLDQADAALAQGDMAKAVRGYVVASGLALDYAAFPEPLPMAPNYQTRALMLHAVYPRNPEDSVALQPLEQHLGTALSYLLLDDSLAARLADSPVEKQVAFLKELVVAIDPGWWDFAARYREACHMVADLGERLKSKGAEGGSDLAGEIEAQRGPEVFTAIPAKLLGREIEGGEWWQYVRELAFLHPAAPLFVSRQFATREVEIIMPRYVKDSPLARALELEVV